LCLLKRLADGVGLKKAIIKACNARKADKDLNELFREYIKRGCDPEELKTVLDTLINEKPLDLLAFFEGSSFYPL